MFRLPTGGLLALGAVALCVMMGEGAMADWSAVYLRSVLSTNESFAAAGYAAFSIAMAAGRFFGDRASARIGPTNLVRWGGLLAAMGLSLALVARHPLTALIGFALVGVGFATIIPMVFTAAGSVAGVAPGIALASVTTMGYFGFLVGPPLIGFVGELIGLPSALGIVVLASVAAVALAPAVGRKKLNP